MPLQTLKIVPRLLPEVRAGIKRHTIRWPETGILPGAMRYVNTMDASDTVLVQVTHVEYMRLSEVACCLGKSADWPDDILLIGMREHCAHIELDSEVMVVHHLPPEA